MSTYTLIDLADQVVTMKHLTSKSFSPEKVVMGLGLKLRLGLELKAQVPVDQMLTMHSLQNLYCCPKLRYLR